MRRLALPIALLAGTACGTAALELDESASSIQSGSAEEALVLAVVNDPTTSFAVLDGLIGLDRRAARNIVERRNGDDGVAGTPDDELFDSIGSLDAVSYVGDRAISKILAYARSNQTGDDDKLILDLVNDRSTTEAVLDDDVGLDRRAAAGIIARRPFATLAELDAVPYVGQSALDKLLEYARATQGGGPSGACVIISEYVEGGGNSNKVIELYNCGTSAIDLAKLSVCLVINDDRSCTRSADLDSGTFAPGDVYTLCKTQTGTFNDPIAPFRDRCDQALPGVMNFNGDDRFAVMDSNGAVLDAIGQIRVRPNGTPWADVGLRRCDFTPYDGRGAFSIEGRFTTHGRYDGSHYGIPPARGCP